MIKKVFKLWPMLIVGISIAVSAFIIKQGAFYRWFGYDKFPEPITDEFDYAWQGISLRKYQLPLGWSTLSDVYKNEKYVATIGELNGFEITANEKLIDLNQFKKEPKPYYAVKEIDYGNGKEHMFFAVPFFDHPPLGGLIYSLGVDKNITEVDQVKSDAFRKPALVLAIVTAVLLYVLLYLITSNPWIGTLGVMVYSIVPTYLLATRTAFLENVVSPISLLQLIVLYLAINKFKNNFLYLLSGLIVGVGILAKEPAVSFVLSSLVLMFINKVPKKYYFSFLFSAAIPVLLYVVWGMWLQKDLFFGVIFANSGREYFGAIKPVTMLEALKFRNFPTDGWWIWGFISFLMISRKNKKPGLLFLIIPLLFHFLAILLLGSLNYPWYFITCIPFLAGCSGVYLWRIISKPAFVSALSFFFIPFSSSYYWGRVALGLQPSISHYRLSFIIFSLLLLLRIKFNKNKFVGFVWIVFMIYMLRKVIIFNEVFFPYLIAHWGNLPIPNLPNF